MIMCMSLCRTSCIKTELIPQITFWFEFESSDTKTQQIFMCILDMAVWLSFPNTQC